MSLYYLSSSMKLVGKNLKTAMDKTAGEVLRLLNIIKLSGTVLIFKALVFFNVWNSRRFLLTEELNVKETQLEKFKRAFHWQVLCSFFHYEKRNADFRHLYLFPPSQVIKELWKWRGSWHYPTWSNSWESFSKTRVVFFSFSLSSWESWFWWEQSPSHYSSVT